MYEDGSFKSINEKLFKMEIESNDDNREIAETTEDTQVSDDLIVLLERFRNELSDVGQELASFYAEYEEKEDLGKITRPEKISIFLNIADQITSSLEKANFDGFGKSVVESIQKFYDELAAQLADIAMNFADLFNLVASRQSDELADEDSEDQSQLEREGTEQAQRFIQRTRTNEIIRRVKQILALLKSKLLNYKQNAVNAPIDEGKEEEVEGSGRVRKNMFLDLGPYQNKQKLIV